ncbi:rhodanese-like domain-containing protein [Phreatobacter aquaticus]|uniref:Rhodanese-like domain-containing protein n=1 Tax=Phreatobacter aquaticus TaxID=2570229 RepID=A0A4D7QGR7_9HYPH|nr:rhodanese-like domain-containing protein [Phreatobacter aquaticus]QCK85891.1 rhodanese-like domain-containing protein [Phreatobacter aquaticus]
MSSSDHAGYAGDVSPSESFDAITQNEQAQIVDVRTTAEWAYVGLPDLKSVNKTPLRAEWQVFPKMDVDAEFVGKLRDALTARGLAQSTPLYFLCRSGVRSKAAAIAMTAAGYPHCFNVTGGFEGPLDPEGRRGHVAGWKFEGLPWAQS